MSLSLLDDYKFQIERIVKRMDEKKQNDVVVFEWFRLHVVQSKLGTSIGHQELVSNLSSIFQSHYLVKKNSVRVFR